MTIPSIFDAVSTGRIFEYLRKANALVAKAALWLDKRAQRKALFDLSDEQLRDIGVSRHDALHEASKFTWRPWL